MVKGFNLEEEEICGHHVSKKVKKIWCVEMDILKEFQRICKKHNLKYFASDGTLLGTIRHKGFIPWDDDIDVCMLAEDYLKFCEIAPKEFSYPYFFQSFETETGGFHPGFSRIRRNDTTACTLHEYNKVPPNYSKGIFIDIFPLYGVSENKLIHAAHRFILLLLNKGIAGFEIQRSLNSGSKIENSRSYLLMLYWKLINIFFSYKKFSNIYVKICCLFKNTKYLGITGIDLSLFNKRYIYEKKWFEKTIDMPFENITVACPKEYDELLKHEYGNYMVFQKGTAMHTMAVIDPEVPFKEKLSK